jgi:hypothetical protein
MAFNVAATATLRSYRNASRFWIMLWLVSGPADHGVILARRSCFLAYRTETERRAAPASCGARFAQRLLRGAGPLRLLRNSNLDLWLRVEDRRVSASMATIDQKELVNAQPFAMRLQER